VRRAKGVGDLARLRAESRVEDQAHPFSLYRAGSQRMAVACTPKDLRDAVSRRQRGFNVYLTTDIAEWRKLHASQRRAVFHTSRWMTRKGSPLSW
jgi:hypothetical protein